MTQYINSKKLKVGLHVWMRKSNCCSAHHQKDEECVIIQIENNGEFLLRSIKTDLAYWHGFECVYIKDNVVAFFSNKDFEI